MLLSSLFSELALALNALEDPFLFGALLVLFAILLAFLRPSYGLSFFVTMGLTFAATHSIKVIYKVARPEDALVAVGGYRFPSMHAALAAALVTSLAWHFYLRHTSLSARGSTILLALLCIIFVSWTRIFLGVHEIIDVVVGSLLGAGISLCIHFLMRKYNLE